MASWSSSKPLLYSRQGATETPDDPPTGTGAHAASENSLFPTVTGPGHRMPNKRPAETIKGQCGAGPPPSLGGGQPSAFPRDDVSPCPTGINETDRQGRWGGAPLSPIPSHGVLMELPLPPCEADGGSVAKEEAAQAATRLLTSRER